MKRNIFNLSLAFVSAVLCFSCASEDAVEVMTAEMVTEGMANSELEITLSSGQAPATASAATRAAIESQTDKHLFEIGNNPGLGIFMLAKKMNTELNSNNLLEIDWKSNFQGYKHTVKLPTTSGDTQQQTFEDVWSVWMDNVQSHAKIVDLGTDKARTEIRWNDGNVRYYPYQTYHMYSFYGYYPRTTAITRTATTVVADYSTFDGKSDFIWARTSMDDLAEDHPHKEWAYSGKFFHFKENRDADDNAKPAQMNFRHLMSRFKFSVIGGGTPIDAITKDYSKAKNVTIKSISICNIPEKLRLTVADRNNPANEGILSIVGKRNMSKYVKLLGAHDEDLGDIELAWAGDTPVEKFLDGSIILPALDFTNPQVTPYFMQLRISYKDEENLDENGDPKVTEMQLSVPLALDPVDGKKMEPGYSYNIKLTIFAPEQVKLTATLEPWVEVDASDVFVTEEGFIKVQ